MGFFQVPVKTLTGKTPARPIVESMHEQESAWDPSTSWYGSEEEEAQRRKSGIRWKMYTSVQESVKCCSPAH